MSMNVGKSAGGDDDVMMDINTTPLIDVMLVLIIMLIIIIPLQTHAVKLDMPQDKSPPPLVQPEVVNVNVDFDGTVSWNGTPVDQPTLEYYIRQAAVKDPQPELHLKAELITKYGPVAQVMASAQRLGLNKIGLVGGERFIDQ